MSASRPQRCTPGFRARPSHTSASPRASRASRKMSSTPGSPLVSCRPGRLDQPHRPATARDAILTAGLAVAWSGEGAKIRASAGSARSWRTTMVAGHFSQPGRPRRRGGSSSRARGNPLGAPAPPFEHANPTPTVSTRSSAAGSRPTSASMRALLDHKRAGPDPLVTSQAWRTCAARPGAPHTYPLPHYTIR